MFFVEAPSREVLENLVPTHNRLRKPDSIKNFEKGDFLEASISNIEGIWYVHDGHHRVVAAIIYDLKIRLKITTHSLLDYTQSNPPIWITPFNPLFEVRRCDFKDYKKAYKDNPLLIREKFLYCVGRQIHTMKDLSEMYIKC
jgi:hypothetical protein